MEIIGAALLAAVSAGSLVLAWYRGLRIGRVILGLFGVLIVGALGAIPGVASYVLNIAYSASGASPMPNWPTGLFLVGCAAGALAGLLATELAIYRWRAKGVAWLTALGGFGIGAGTSYLTLMYMQNSSWSEQAWMILSPLSVGAATVAGYSLKAGQH